MSTISPLAADQLELPLMAGSDDDQAQRLPSSRTRRSRRARRLQIKVSPFSGIEVIVPMRVSQRAVDQFVAKHQDWMQKAWEKLLKEYPEAGGWQLPCEIHLPITRHHWEVRFDPAAARFKANRKVITLAGEKNSAGHALRLQGWLRQQAARVLPKRVSDWSEITGLEPNGVNIRGQATRWGSCSSKGTLSLNFRLMFLEPELVDCLIVHELCHLKHMNHGKRFWNLMEKFMPDARERDRALGAAWRDVPAWAQVKKGE